MEDCLLSKTLMFKRSLYWLEFKCLPFPWKRCLSLMTPVVFPLRVLLPVVLPGLMGSCLVHVHLNIQTNTWVDPYADFWNSVSASLSPPWYSASQTAFTSRVPVSLQLRKTTVLCLNSLSLWCQFTKNLQAESWGIWELNSFVFSSQGTESHTACSTSDNCFIYIYMCFYFYNFFITGDLIWYWLLHQCTTIFVSISFFLCFGILICTISEWETFPFFFLTPSPIKWVFSSAFISIPGSSPETRS